MNKNLCYWGIGAFIFFKAAFDAAFDSRESISIIAALLLAGMIATSVHILNSGYNFVVTRHITNAPRDTLLSFWLPASKVLTICFFGVAIVGKIIIFAFSKRLNEAIYDEIYWDNLGYVDGWVIYLCIIALPLIAHYLLLIYSLRVALILQVLPIHSSVSEKRADYKDMSAADQQKPQPDYKISSPYPRIDIFARTLLESDDLQLFIGFFGLGKVGAYSKARQMYVTATEEEGARLKATLSELQKQGRQMAPDDEIVREYMHDFAYILYHRGSPDWTEFIGGTTPSGQAAQYIAAFNS
jgi:hypothetical protein